ncbi:MAG: C45 family autoproteolytic acyltransferase/hydrolase [Pikeienuella sp.]|uniref:C45 family autoproteolytic acyltransferase/hydolase n=1 Tax=Pikeienuella sp. TaxID=2831957 RepID=UPI00391D3D3F
MRLLFRAVEEAEPGPKWAGLFAEYWPAYRRWWGREGVAARPTWREGRNAIRRHMPEILDLHEELSELAGGGDAAARFLSFLRPPAYLAGCSQAVWPGETPLLVRNYDYNPHAFDAVLLKTRWRRGVIAMTDGLFGVIDGMNDAGLAVSLTFGGRREIGEGFGVPLILRYVLETCENAAEAAAALKRIPCHMSYNVTALDAARRFVTVWLAPDREALVTHAPVATNHQERVEWAHHARFTATVERERFLLQRLTLHPETEERFIGAFLRPPLYSTAFAAGFGTLYTAAWRPAEGAMALCWPGADWPQSFAAFEEGARQILTPEAIPAPL